MGIVEDEGDEGENLTGSKTPEKESLSLTPLSSENDKLSYKDNKNTTRRAREGREAKIGGKFKWRT